jgi:hypothetical protein
VGIFIYFLANFFSSSGKLSYEAVGDGITDGCPFLFIIAMPLSLASKNFTKARAAFGLGDYFCIVIP